jgi:hypothetical protein
LHYLPALELIEKTLSEFHTAFALKYGYDAMNKTAMKAGEAVGVPNVYSTSNHWGFVADRAAAPALHSRENLTQFIGSVKEGRASGVFAFLYSYRVCAYFARWAVRWQVLLETIEEFIDACVQWCRGLKDVYDLPNELQPAREAKNERMYEWAMALLSRAESTLGEELPPFDPQGTGLPGPAARPIRDLGELTAASPALKTLWERAKAAYLESESRYNAAERAVDDRERELYNAREDKLPRVPTTIRRLLEESSVRVNLFVSTLDIADAAFEVRKADALHRLVPALPTAAERLRKEAERMTLPSVKADLLREADKLEKLVPETEADAKRALDAAHRSVDLHEGWLRSHVLNKAR